MKWHMIPSIVKRALGSFFVLALCIGALEMVFRTGISMKMPLFRDPGLYADWTTDDDYWKLRHLWQKKASAVSSEVLDPLLGWSPNRSKENPLGVVGTHPKSLRYSDPVVLWYGDSFVQGKGAWKDRLPALAQAHLGLANYNFGVRGYGLDQIVLNFQQTRHYFKNPAIVLGILTVDLDRSILKFRTGQKPKFIVDKGEITIAGLPIDPKPDRWIAANPPQIESYLVAFMKRRWALYHSANELEVVEGRDEKIRVNAKVLDLIANECSSQKMPLVAILFYNKEELSYVGWREGFLKAQLVKRRIPFIDSKRVLLEAASHSNRPLESWYDLDGHLNVAANALLAKELARVMRERRLLPIAERVGESVSSGSSVGVSP
jgi:hypothetical protein